MQRNIPKVSKSLLTIFIIFSSIAAIYALKFFFNPSQSPTSLALGAKVKGPRNASIQIVEFIDFQCPSCAMGAQFLKQLMEQYPNKIHIELKYYPLTMMHRHALLSAHYAECAARQGKFWRFHDYLIERQSQWDKLINPRPVFNFFAKQVNLDAQKLQACLEDQSIIEFIQNSKEEGKLLKVHSTPTYFINGKMIVGKEQLEAELKKLLSDDEKG